MSVSYSNNTFLDLREEDSLSIVEEMAVPLSKGLTVSMLLWRYLIQHPSRGARRCTLNIVLSKQIIQELDKLYSLMQCNTVNRTLIWYNTFNTEMTIH